jgi:hypothetical protein
LETTVINENLIQEEMTRLNSDNACYQSVQSILFSRLSKNIKIILYKIVILPWSLTLREKHSTLRVFENRVLRRIFGPKRDGVTGGQRKLHNMQLHNFSPSVIRMIKPRRMRWARNVAQIGETTMQAYMLLMGKLYGKRPLGRLSCRWVDNKLELEKKDGVWIGLAQDRGNWRVLVKAVMNLRVL